MVCSRKLSALNPGRKHGNLGYIIKGKIFIQMVCNHLPLNLQCGEEARTFMQWMHFVRSLKTDANLDRCAHAYF